MKSVWSEFSMPVFDSLKGDIKTDVLIIGGGIAGLLIALELKHRGIDSVVAEQKRICGGITKNTTAKITVQHGFICSKLIKSVGKDDARLYLDANTEALEKYKRICKNLNCDFKLTESYAFSQGNPFLIESELSALESLGYDASFEDKTSLPFAIAGAVRFKNQAQFHPLKFAAEIAKEIKIYENTPVLAIDKSTAKTPCGNIFAKAIVIATHFPFLNKHGMYFLKLYQSRSYLTAINNLKTNGIYIDEGGLSFRSYDALTLIGCGEHRTGKPSLAWKEAEGIAKRYYPRSKILYKWAAQDCMTLDGLAYIGNYSKALPNVYVATGFNKWGMTTSMVASEIIADLICQKENDYARLFSPSRSMLKKQLAINMLESTKNLLRPTAPRCPHMKCALKWNPNEHSWDCACHGSRFTEYGKVIDNPATKPLK